MNDASQARRTGPMKRVVGPKVEKRCPKCGGADFDVNETMEVVGFNEVRNGVIVFADYAEPCGTVRAEGACISCGHAWSMKRAAVWNQAPNA